MYRKTNFDIHLAEEMKNPEFRRQFFLGLYNGENEEPPLSLLKALKISINAMGVTEYSEAIGLQRTNVSRFLSSEKTPLLETLDKYLEPFGVRAKLIVEDVA